MIGGNFQRSGMGGAPAPLPQGGIQGRAQANVPYQGMYNGNPRGANNTPQAPAFAANSAWQQQQQYGRYVPPTMQQSGSGGWNSNTWNQNQGPYNYNIPGSWGSPLGNGQFAPMPGMFQGYVPQQWGGGMGGTDFDQRAALLNFDPQRYEELYMQQPLYTTQGGGMTPGNWGPEAPSARRDNRMMVDDMGKAIDGKDGRPLALRDNRMNPPAPTIPEFQPTTFQRYGTRPEDQVPGGGMSQMDWLGTYGDRAAYDAEVGTQQAAWENAQRINYRNQFRR